MTISDQILRLSGEPEAINQIMPFIEEPHKMSRGELVDRFLIIAATARAIKCEKNDNCFSFTFKDGSQLSVIDNF